MRLFIPMRRRGVNIMRSVTMLLKLLMQHFRVFERMLTASTEKRNGNSGQQQRGKELHGQIKEGLGDAETRGKTRAVQLFIKSAEHAACSWGLV